MSTQRIAHLLYHGTLAENREYLKEALSEEELYIYAYNYNWENGFSIPELILKHPACSLEIALLVFYRGDGYTFLTNQDDEDETSKWYIFIKNLHDNSICGKYQLGQTAFSIPLSKVQIYKLKKTTQRRKSSFHNRHRRKK